MKNQKMQRFLKSIGIEEASRYDMDFLSVSRDATKSVRMVIKKESPWDSDLIEEFIEHLANVNYAYSLSFEYENNPSFEDVELLFNNYILSHYRTLPSSSLSNGEGNKIYILEPKENTDNFDRMVSDFNSYLSFLNYDFELIKTKELIKKEESRPIEKNIEESKKEATPISNNIEIEEEEEDESEDERENLSIEEIEQNNEMDEYLKQEIKATEESYLSAIRAENERIEHQKIYQKGNYEKLESIKDCYTTKSSTVEVEGYLYGIDEKNPTRLSRKGKLMMSAGIGEWEYGAAINIRLSESRGLLSKEDISQFNAKSNGTRVLVKGAIDKDFRTGQKQIFVHYIEKLPPKPLREDKEEVQRVELHLHSKFSAMDGLGDIEDYLKLAIHWGMPALAITDHGAIQCFPAAEKAMGNINKARKKAGLSTDPIKLLYGCEFYMFDRPVPIINRVSNERIANKTYCVFDFETTGLSHVYDRPIEFGAVIVGPDGMPIKRIDRFIDPERELSKGAMEVNHITKEMLVGAPKMQEAIKEISEFIGDSILVAHNAQFDLDFLNIMRKSAGMPPVDNVVVDTLQVAKFLFPDAGSVNEKALTSRLNIQGESDKFHRADYDAEQLSKIWLAMIPLLQEKYKNPDITFADLNNLPIDSQNFYRLLISFHTTVIAKNNAGLKALYKLISESETTYLAPQSRNAPTPLLPREFLQENRENLLVGSACFNGRVFEMAMNGTQEELEEEMKFYDYIEIQPKENYSWLIGMEMIDQDRLMDILQRIVDTAKRLGKRIVATGDCHYVNPEEKITRDVYINTAGLGKSIHPLNRGRSHHAPFPNPDQHFRSTREMLDSFRTWLPEEECQEYVIKNTREIADMCEPMKVLKDKLYTPVANLPDSDVKLREICYGNLKKTYGDNPDPQVKARLDRELDGIISNGYAVTYYIAHLLVKHAAEDNDNPQHMGYFIGSRGSVGSSFAATMAGITEVNPLPPHYLCPHCKHFEWANDQEEFRTLRSGFDLPKKKCPECGTDLLRNGQSIPFETFLGFKADKVPDIDLNFPADYQAKGHLYTREILSTPEENEAYRKGEFVHSPHVIRAGTIAAAQEKNAYAYARDYFRDVKHEELNNENRAYCAFLGNKCAGVKRTTGQHPGGIVVIPADMDIFDFTPFQHPADDPEAEWLTTHFEFASMHDSVLKLDELGHVDPVALRMQCYLTGINVSDAAEAIPLDDKRVLSLFSSPDELHLKKNPLGLKTGARALPEFGTSFVQGLLEEAKPKTFNDLLIISGLSHGTDVWNNNAEDLVVKQGRSLDDVVGCRDDIMNYLISMGVEPSMSFHIMEDVRHGKGTGGDPNYDVEMKKHNVPDWYIESLNKIKYLFPRAHAAAYVIGAVRVAWFKLYHPLEFYTTYFTTRCDKFNIKIMSGPLDGIVDRINAIKNDPEASDTDKEELNSDLAACEMVDRGYKIENISLMESEAEIWKVCKERNSIIPPFKVISGFPSLAAEGIVKARAEGNFISQEDLMSRVKKTVNEEESKKTGNTVYYSIGTSAIEALKDVGALEGLSESNQMSLFDF